MATQQKKSWYNFTIKAESPQSVDIFIHEAIGSWDISAKQFIKDLLALDAAVNVINLHINSPGGEVFDGIAIYEALKGHKATVNVYISGLAASISSIIALAGDKVHMSENSYFMIHSPSMGWWTAEEMRAISVELASEADLLDRIETSLVNIYAKESGKSVEDIATAVKATTWYTAAEAKAAGFVDEVTSPVAATANFQSMEKRGYAIPTDIAAKLKANCPGCKQAKPEPKPQSAWEKIKAAFGRKTPKAGATLGDKLNAVIDSMVTDTVTRDDIIANMATASGMTVEEVTKDIDGTNECPTLATLSAYSTVLATTLAELKTAAETDGCDFAEAAADAEEETTAKAVAIELHNQLVVAQTQLLAEQGITAALTKQLTELGQKPAAKATAVPAKDLLSGREGGANGTNAEAAFLAKNKEISAKDKKKKNL